MDLIEQIKAKLIEYDEKDIARIGHAMRVHSFARFIAAAEGLDPTTCQVIEVAALLHDIGIHSAIEKYGSKEGKYQEQEGAIIAEELLRNIEITQKEKERVCYLISKHHTYNNIESLDYQILIEADYIVKIGDEGYSKEAVKDVLEKLIRTETATLLIKQFYL